MIKILLFEDNDRYYAVLRKLFGTTDDLYLVARYTSGYQAAKRVTEHEPDIILMDIEMPEVSGLNALKAIKDRHPDAKVMMNTQFEDDHSLFIALCLGATGYAVKGEPFAKLKSAIMDVHEGGGFFSSHIAGRISSFFKDIGTVKNLEHIPLTKTEQEILALLCTGLSHKEIAAERHNSFHTVHSHLKSIYKKLHVNSKSEAILKALNLKLV